MELMEGDGITELGRKAIRKNDLANINYFLSDKVSVEGHGEEVCDAAWSLADRICYFIKCGSGVIDRFKWWHVYHKLQSVGAARELIN